MKLTYLIVPPIIKNYPFLTHFHPRIPAKSLYIQFFGIKFGVPQNTKRNVAGKY